MKIETVGLGPKVQTLTLDTYDVRRLILEKLGIAGLEMSDETKVVIESRWPTTKEQGHSLTIERYSEDFRGRRPRK